MSRPRRTIIWLLEWAGAGLCRLGGDDPRTSTLTYWGWELAGVADRLKPGRSWGP